MLSIVSSRHAPAPSLRRPRPTKCTSPRGDRNAFHILASLQLAVDSISQNPTENVDLLSGSNPLNLRKQGQLALTFALANLITCSNPERIALANKLEDAIDKAFLKEDYRSRVYKLGGILAADVENDGKLVRGLLNGRISINRLAVGTL